ncbi:hypothetical protein M1N58_02120 [Dehalococcoidales bacterium]|nr:hypothetical protein [Dehalococcoidales bacterium]
MDEIGKLDWTFLDRTPAKRSDLAEATLTTVKVWVERPKIRLKEVRATIL